MIPGVALVLTVEGDPELVVIAESEQDRQALRHWITSSNERSAFLLLLAAFAGTFPDVDALHDADETSE